jgi:thiamine-phosphate pyrophosphorylase
MPGRCLLYYITDRAAFGGDEPTRRRRLLEKIAEATRAGVDYIQLREKDLPTRELELLAREAVGSVREETELRTENRELRTHVLINSRTDIALATAVDGVHLRSNDISPEEVRKVWNCSPCGAGTPARENQPPNPLIAVSCHSIRQVAQAAKNAASFVVFAPVFEKPMSEKAGTPVRPAGLSLLAEACRANLPVLALGGVTLENAQSCLNAGAAGIAAIRLFQENNMAEIVQKLGPTETL